jgi:hypothetical protein
LTSHSQLFIIFDILQQRESISYRALKPAFLYSTKMPVIPESSDFPSVPQKGESDKKDGKDTQKAAAQDFLSKGPQIPDGKWPKKPMPLPAAIDAL